MRAQGTVLPPMVKLGYGLYEPTEEILPRRRRGTQNMEPIGEPSKMGKRFPRHREMATTGGDSQDQSVKWDGPADEIGIWDDGCVTDWRGDFCGDIRDEI